MPNIRYSFEIQFNFTKSNNRLSETNSTTYQAFFQFCETLAQEYDRQICLVAQNGFKVSLVVFCCALVFGLCCVFFLIIHSPSKFDFPLLMNVCRRYHWHVSEVLTHPLQILLWTNWKDEVPYGW